MTTTKVEVLGTPAKPLAVAAFELALSETTVGELKNRLMSVTALPVKKPSADKDEWPAGSDPKVVALGRQLAGVSSIEKFRLHDLHIDPSIPVVQYVWRSIWTDAAGKKTRWEDHPAEHAVTCKPWQPDHVLPFEPEDHNQARQLRSLARQEWDAMEQRLLAALRDGSQPAAAKVGSPLSTTFTPIAPDAWEHLKVTDWERSTATSDAGEMLFAVHILSGQPLVPPTRVSRSKKPIQRERARLIIEHLYPSGVPHDLTDESLVAHVHEKWQPEDGPVRPSKDTIKRAAKRR